ncbi:MAG: hypothetical protein PHP64_00770 [Actinomycetota bacterium]|nr:hypothetical protein [Actinomycetota bacterium]
MYPGGEYYSSVSPRSTVSFIRRGFEIPDNNREGAGIEKAARGKLTVRAIDRVKFIRYHVDENHEQNGSTSRKG